MRGRWREEVDEGGQGRRLREEGRGRRSRERLLRGSGLGENKGGASEDFHGISVAKLSYLGLF